MDDNSAKVVIKIYSILSWIAGIAYVLLGLAILLLNKGMTFGFNNIKFSQTTFIIIGLVILVLGALIIVLAINLWRFKNWARIVSVVLICIGILFSILSLISKISVGMIISIVISLIFFYFLAIDKGVIKVFNNPIKK